MKARTIAAAAIGPLIFLALLVTRRLRRRQVVAEEVSALRDLGNGQRDADKSLRRKP
jgi:hypothetical protein